MCKFREKNGMQEQINFDLSYAVLFNLASQYQARTHAHTCGAACPQVVDAAQASGLMTEALNTYALIVKNKQYPYAGRLRVNMGNIYFQQKK